MAEHLLNKTDVGTVIHHQRGHGVAEQVTAATLADVGLLDVFTDQTTETVGSNVKTVVFEEHNVSPFVRGNKSDKNDAIAIAEASRRPNILPVPIKPLAQQEIQCLHRIRERHVKHRTGLSNQVRGLLSEYRIVAPQGNSAFCKLLREISQPEYSGISPLIKPLFNETADEYYYHSDQIDEIYQKLKEIANTNPLCKILCNYSAESKNALNLGYLRQKTP